MNYLITMITLFITCGSVERIEISKGDLSPVLSSKSIMAIFAHPDDESTIAPVLSRYVREGARVQLVIATDGRLGVNDYTDYKAGDGLAAIRKSEMICAAEKLGVELIHLDYHDQLKAGEGYDGHMPQAQSLIKEIHALITKYEPDVLLTFGPDGGSNHMDHRLIGATVTSVFLSQDWHHKPSLYFVGTPSENIQSNESKILRGIDKKYLKTKISFSKADLEAAIESMSCHASQFQVEKIRNRMESRYSDNRVIYFRKFEGPIAYSESLF